MTDDRPPDQRVTLGARDPGRVRACCAAPGWRPAPAMQGAAFHRMRGAGGGPTPPTGP